RLEQQLQRLQPATAEIRQERDAAVGRLDAAQQQIDQLRGQMAELPRLRGEVARLRGATQELAQLKSTDQKWPALRHPAELAASLATHVEKLKQMLAQKPELN